MFYMLRTCVRVVLLICFYFSCLVFLYSSRGFPYWLHIIFLRMLFCFLMVIRYIVIDTNPVFFLKSLLYILQMFVSCSIFPVLELAHIMFLFYWILDISHIVSVSILCSSRNLFIFSILVFLHFINWLFSSLLLKPLSKLQSKPSLDL